MKTILCHSIERTSPKGQGQPAIGYCIQCGEQGLTFKDVFKECPNTLGLTQDESLIRAIEGPNDRH